jgi:hypothetical protein
MHAEADVFASKFSYANHRKQETFARLTEDIRCRNAETNAVEYFFKVRAKGVPLQD